MLIKNIIIAEETIRLIVKKCSSLGQTHTYCDIVIKTSSEISTENGPD